ncbi:hypothetical protein SAMN06264346_1066 [Chryseobacterium profundimaris]|uniref:Uncharacterized protein n=2 Tax=Chryseobacterium profundimaris TaxID=1387275 RepID=A0ABY1NXG3_9FLAO|nr:hypothetical protein SAMN06264346_1066 [Chryseobacterium profundimaris]
MGGPWVGNLYINEIEIDNKIIINNYLEDTDFYYFVKYFEVSKKQRDNFFCIVRTNKRNLVSKISKEKFEKIYIRDIKENILFYSEGFHKNLPIINLILNFY